MVAWIGLTDLRAASGDSSSGLGPIAQALEARTFDRVVLLWNKEKSEAERYVAWLKKRKPVDVQIRMVKLASPTDFGDIYHGAVDTLSKLVVEDKNLALTIHLSPGTPAMAAVWIILAKTRFPAELIESSKEQGVRTTSVPFDISADFIPDLMRRPDEELARLTQGLSPEAPEFDAIVHRCSAMKRIVARARRVSPRSVSVLLLGESGTGKELLARAIHQASPRKEGPFIPVNCGAIPGELVESELFGHEKGAFSGAASQHKGHIERAHKGTLFLDEIGDLPLSAQVKLLRALDERKIRRVGGTDVIEVDFRVVAATNKDLLAEIRSGKFREDLFHRIGVAIIRIPPLREREGDLTLLIDHALKVINREGVGQPGYEEKHLSAGARSLLGQQEWTGNMRALTNTILRAAVWASGKTIERSDIQDALLTPIGSEDVGVLGRPLGEALKLTDLLAEVATHYLKRALDEARGNKTAAAKLVGLPSYQTLTNWLKRYGLDKVLARQLR
jgi:DNA-binding NtrC family response regulator